MKRHAMYAPRSCHRCSAAGCERCKQQGFTRGPKHKPVPAHELDAPRINWLDLQRGRPS